FNGAALRRTRKATAIWAGGAATFWLQWSRAQENAEAQDPEGLPVSAIVASMEPRSGERGRVAPVAELSGADLRLIWRRAVKTAETQEPKRLTASASVASMEPRLAERGRDAPLTDFSAADLSLQWSRAQENAEGSTTCCGSSTTRGFNGAALRRTRKQLW